MKLKPKNTVHNIRALQYKRFIGLEKSSSLSMAYKTTSDEKYWTFDNLELKFTQVDGSSFQNNINVIAVENYNTILQYQKTYFRYNGSDWEEITDLSESGIILLSAKYNNIAKYQTNKYYYVGSFDFMIKGSIEGTTSQYIKGNIIPLTSLNIKYFDDDISLSVDDLVVVNNKLYSVENPETTIKQMPSPFKVYFATLNSIL